MSNLSTRAYDRPKGDAPITKFDNIMNVLIHPIQNRHRLKCERYPFGPDKAKEGDPQVLQEKCDLYECQPQSPRNEDLQATMPAKAM